MEPAQLHKLFQQVPWKLALYSLTTRLKPCGQPESSHSVEEKRVTCHMPLMQRLAILQIVVEVISQVCSSSSSSLSSAISSSSSSSSATSSSSSSSSSTSASGIGASDFLKQEED
nr:hypothetical protein Iba_chr03cCG10040 [Ipomoea batatas]